jgi:hypothetical protein
MQIIRLTGVVARCAGPGGLIVRRTGEPVGFRAGKPGVRQLNIWPGLSIEGDVSYLNGIRLLCLTGTFDALCGGGAGAGGASEAGL